ncbi:hypothetical protein PR048_006657 [Dryococelus australis]|uniref:Uncharacterized protein n=1 Tax=Dryococelus australis TaxID=614101 RepID=A0ABQ9IBJ5_9NEOP|nr:hypothetical protein PR048_006657 [Dryococelus australis]
MNFQKFICGFCTFLCLSLIKKYKPLKRKEIVFWSQSLICLKERHRHNFVPLKVRELMNNCKQDGLCTEEDCPRFLGECQMLYEACISDLEKWTTNFEEFQCFK